MHRGAPSAPEVGWDEAGVVLTRAHERLVGHVRARDPLQAGSEAAELRLAEPAREVLADPAKVSLRGPPQTPQPLVGEAREGNPAVTGIGTPPDQPFGGEAIDQACHTAGRHQDPFGQVRHAKRPIRRPREPEQDVVFRKQEVVFLAKLEIQ
jgi:hypothetical protein